MPGAWYATSIAEFHSLKCFFSKMNYYTRFTFFFCLNYVGVQSRFGVGVGRLEWLDNEDSWSLTGLNGESLGYFKVVVTSDKSTFSQRFTNVTGKPVPIGKRYFYILLLVNNFIGLTFMVL